MPSLFVIQGRDQGKRFELADQSAGLGRDTTNAIQIHDTEVSRRHAEIRPQDGGYLLVDLNSSNGTYINSRRVEHQPLHSGDRIQLGRTMLIFTFTGGSDQDSAALVGAVDIVGRSEQQRDESRIVKAISQEEGSQIFDAAEDSGSPWLARARSNLQVMYRTALAVSHTLDIDQLCHRILELIFEWVEADRGCIMLVDSHSGQLQPQARRNRQGVRGDAKMSISGTILDYVMKQKEGVLTSDARDDERWDPAGSIVRMGVREAICVPMQGRYGIVGVIYIDTYTPPGRLNSDGKANRFHEEHLKMMVAIAHQAALAVEDTSYYSAMVQAERLAAIGQTIAGLSHHIKNILQGIRGGSYLIEEGLKHDDPEAVRKGWSFVEKNQEKISKLVLDMLTFSKDRQPEMVAADLNPVVAEVVELMQVRARENQVELTFHPDESIPTMTFDPEGLHHAVLNVVTNAIDACADGQGDRVTVTTGYLSASKQLSIVVEDNGRGIEPNKIATVFDIFQSSKGSRGTGLGLAVSQKILREHDGDIRVESHLGSGSRFTLELPAVEPHATDDFPDLSKTVT